MQKERLLRRNLEILGGNACSSEYSLEGKKRWSAGGCEVEGRETIDLHKERGLGPWRQISKTQRNWMPISGARLHNGHCIGRSQ